MLVFLEAAGLCRRIETDGPLQTPNRQKEINALSFLKGKGLHGLSLGGRTRLKFFCVLALVFTVVGFSACGDSGDDDNADNRASANSSANASSTAPAGSIDPKSLTNVNSETFLGMDEIGGQIPKPNVTIAVDSKRTPTINVRGWAVDQRAKTAAGGVIVNVDGKTDLVTNYGQPRPDVATNLKSPSYTNCGFVTSLDVTGLEKGRHTLTMRVVTTDRKGYFEQKQKYDIDVQ
jgi:hypothetical protein